MKSFEETLAFIETKAAEHSRDETDWEYEFIELEAFAAIIQFSLTEGFAVPNYDLADFVAKAHGHGADEDEKNVFTMMYDICEELEIMEENCSIPEKTAQLFSYWKRTFWPDTKEGDDGDH